MGFFRHDLGYALRMLVRNPGFAIAAIATLALGIGASTAIVSVAYGVSARPLPYPNPDRLVRIYEASPAMGSSNTKCRSARSMNGGSESRRSKPLRCTARPACVSWRSPMERQ